MVLMCQSLINRTVSVNVKHYFGERSFGYVAPTVWNSLPADLRASPSLPTFKVNLKTH